MIRQWKHSAICIFILTMLSLGAHAEEGMYPITALGKLDLRSKGLQVESSEIFNPGGVGFVQAIVHLGGCTGSFVSNDGLILTNHHCAFGYVEGMSSPDHDYVTDGFLAPTHEEERPAKGATARIIDSYQDVSGEIISSADDTLDALSRSQAIETRSKELVKRSEADHPGMKAEVSEMIAGKSYVLFLYTVLKDIRLVYVPPRMIGEYGGEDDNFAWPRQAGDFSFMRAYVAPDGSPAPYAKENIPYHPRKYLHVQVAGVKEDDPVFILGYPGRTFRHRPASYLRLEEEVRMPLIVDLYTRQIGVMTERSKESRALALKFEARIKSLANVVKNYSGKILGMKRLHLIDAKSLKEKELMSYIESSPLLKQKYGTVLASMDSLYTGAQLPIRQEYLLESLQQASVVVGQAFSLCGRLVDWRKLEEVGDTTGLRQQKAGFLEGCREQLRNLDQDVDEVLLTDVLVRLHRLPAGGQIPAVEAWLDGDTSEADIRRKVSRLFRSSGLLAPESWESLLSSTSTGIWECSDPLMRFVAAMGPSVELAWSGRRARESRIAKLQAELNDVLMQYARQEFIPDANSSLRFTCGRIKGYSPRDATFCAPITTLNGVLEKATGSEPFAPPLRLVECAKRKMWGRYALPGLDTVPVDLLYDLDTTGGNSGSPLLNAKGEIVGVNFDRAFEATVNDYAWSARYSRSVAVDIRYVLWVASEVSGATFLAREVGVEN